MPAPGTATPVGLTFFFPAYNDAGTIASLVIQAVQVASRLTPDFEVLVINDGSQDAKDDHHNQDFHERKCRILAIYFRHTNTLC